MASLLGSCTSHGDGSGRERTRQGADHTEHHALLCIPSTSASLNRQPFLCRSPSQIDMVEMLKLGNGTGNGDSNASGSMSTAALAPSLMIDRAMAA